MMKIAGSILGLALLAGFAAPASAQTASDVELTRARIQTARQAIIADAMKLTEDEGLAFWPAYRDYRVEMARLGERLVKVVSEFAASGAALSDEQANRLLDEFIDIKGDEVALQKKHAPAAIAGLAFFGATGLLLFTVTVIARGDTYRSLRAQLLASFAIIVTIPAILAIFISAVGAYVNNESQILNVLETISKLKESQINEVMNIIKADATRNRPGS